MSDAILAKQSHCENWLATVVPHNPFLPRLFGCNFKSNSRQLARVFLLVTPLSGCLDLLSLIAFCSDTSESRKPEQEAEKDEQSVFPSLFTPFL